MIGSGSAFQRELCAMLVRGRFFGDLPEEQTSALARYVQAYAAAPRTVVFREGEAGSFMCLLLDGSAKIYKQDHHFGTKCIGSVDAGKTLGEMALIDGEPRSATCICDAPSTLIMLSRENFVRIVREEPALSVNILLKLVSLMSRRLRVTSGQLVDYLEARG